MADIVAIPIQTVEDDAIRVFIGRIAEALGCYDRPSIRGGQDLLEDIAHIQSLAQGALP